MGEIVGPIGSGVQGITDLNPWAGVLVGCLLVCIIVLWKALLDRTKELNAEKDARRVDKDKQLDEARQDKEFYERLADRSAGAKRRGAT